MALRRNGSARMGPLTNGASSSSSSADASSEKVLSIPVTLPTWITSEAGLPISALTVEKCGGEWFLLIHTRGPYHSTRLHKFPVKDIKISGQSLDRYLNAVGVMLYWDISHSKRYKESSSST